MLKSMTLKNLRKETAKTEVKSVRGVCSVANWFDLVVLWSGFRAKWSERVIFATRKYYPGL